MKIRTLVWSEIIHRKLNFALGLAAVALAVALGVGVVTVVRAYEIGTSERVRQQQERTKERVRKLDNEIRKITKAMGFNIMILPKDQNLVDFYASDYATKTMPQEFVQRLADSPDVITINHLRPSLIQKIEWPEQRRQVLLMGVSGVVPFKHRDPKKPLAEPVPVGKMNMGAELAKQLGLKKGSKVTLRDEKFTINKIYQPRGNKDDVTVWIDLPKAQQMLNMSGRINMIQALECNCASIDRLAEIQQEVARVLSSDGDKVQVIEMRTKAIARAKARTRVSQEGAKAVDEERAAGMAHIGRLRRLAGVLMPLVVIGAALLVALLALLNVRERRAEIGILRAVGVRSRQIFALFVCKAALLGVSGALIGYLAGFLGASAFYGMPQLDVTLADGLPELFRPGVAGLVMIVTPLVVVVASWLPAAKAATQDPAVVLREE